MPGVGLPWCLRFHLRNFELDLSSSCWLESMLWLLLMIGLCGGNLRFLAAVLMIVTLKNTIFQLFFLWGIWVVVPNIHLLGLIGLELLMAILILIGVQRFLLSLFTSSGNRIILNLTCLPGNSPRIAWNLWWVLPSLWFSGIEICCYWWKTKKLSQASGVALLLDKKEEKEKKFCVGIWLWRGAKVPTACKPTIIQTAEVPVQTKHRTKHFFFPQGKKNSSGKRYEWSRMQGTLVESCILFLISSTFLFLVFW